MDKIEKIGDLVGVGPQTELKLKESGMDTLVSIAVISPAQLAEITGMSEKACRKLIQQARENTGFNFISADKQEKSDEQRFRITTSSKALDQLIGGGYQSQGIHEVYGKAGSSKSQLGFQLCINVQKQIPNAKVLWIDTEGTFEIKRIRELCQAASLNPESALKNIQIIRPYNTDMQLFFTEKAEELIKNDTSIKLLVVDSLLNHFRVDYQARGKLADRQQKLNKHLHHLNRMAQIYNIVVYYTNQVQMNPGMMYGNPLTPCGGEVLSHQSTTRVYLSKTSKGIVARMIDSSSLPNGECVFKITQKGIEDV